MVIKYQWASQICMINKGVYPGSESCGLKIIWFWAYYIGVSSMSIDKESTLIWEFFEDKFKSMSFTYQGFCKYLSQKVKGLWALPLSPVEGLSKKLWLLYQGVISRDITFGRLNFGFKIYHMKLFWLVLACSWLCF